MAMNPRLMRPLAKTPPGTPASLLLRFDGADASTDFVDSSPSNLTVTAYGDAQISTAQSKFGGSSAYFDGDGDYLTGSLEMDHSADFTIEMWIRISSLSGYQCLLEMGDIFTNGGGLQIYFAAADGNTINFGNASTTTIIGTAVNADEWIHVAAVRQGGTSTLYINGASAGSLSITFPVVGDTFTIGEAPGYSQPFSGYIDDFRIVPGLAVYTGPFIPPTQQLSAYATPQPIEAQASLLLHFDGDLDDSSVNNLTVTANGDATTSTSQSKFGGSSLYCDGTGDYIDIGQTGSALHGATEDFTIECWVRPASFTGQAVFGTRPVSPYADDCLILAVDSFGNPFLHTNNTAMVNSGTAIAVDEWSHLAVVRSGNVFSLYVNGVSVGSYTGAFTLNGTENALIGAEPRGENGNFNGYIDDLRIVKGLAVYTASFTPPTAPLSATVTPV